MQTLPLDGVATVPFSGVRRRRYGLDRWSLRLWLSRRDAAITHPPSVSPTRKFLADGRQLIDGVSKLIEPALVALLVVLLWAADAPP